ncbi:flagellar hook-basal body complex protein FliE [Bordetella sp. FB-8]|uniref:flagellar hook-basal body complex protein FliE n=1 Tax=Bordetella sp. FB-8 TaxID=1159870 RepID=UPI000377D3E5|nr:flagellar hook-basal body complex protein FliE [Bordetella sp. FB-8]
MAVSGISGVESMLQQMRALVQAAQQGISDPSELSPTVSSTQGATSFADELRQSVQRISDAQQAAKLQAEKFELGDPNVSLNDVMINTQKANIGFQTAVQVRDRLVSAYNTISQITM